MLNQDDLKALYKVTGENGIVSSLGWTNFSENVALPDAVVLQIETEEQVIAVVKALYAINEKKDAKEKILYRPLSGGKNQKYSKSFSLTKCGEADVIFNLVGKEFETIKVIDEENHLVMVGPSIQVGELDKRLYYDHELMLKHLASLIERVQRSGLMANAGHGTGNKSGSYADNVVAYRFLLPNGEIVYLDKRENDPLFDDLAPAHLGNVGIDLGAVVQCKPAKKLKCVIEAMSLPEFLERTAKGEFVNDKKSMVSAMYAPTYQHDLTNRDIKNVVVYHWTPVPINTPNQNYHPGIRLVEQRAEIELSEGLHTTDLLSAFPEIIPAYMEYVVGSFGIGEGVKEIIGPFPDVYHYQVQYPHKLNDFDCLFEISDDCHEMVDAFTQLAIKTQEAADRGEYPITYSAYARVFQGTNGGLSTSSHREGKKVCGFDVVSSPNIPGFEPLRDAMVKYLIETYHAKLHWGKYIPDTIDYAAMYGEQMEKYKRALLAWYDRHHLKIEKNPALNNFFCRILNMPKEMTPAPLAQTVDDTTMSPVSIEEALKIINQLSSLLAGQGQHSKHFCEHLDNIREKYALANAKHSSLYGSSKPTSSNPSLKKDEREDNDIVDFMCQLY
jgi:hypothetical protein